jgi:hypothetical protein
MVSETHLTACIYCGARNDKLSDEHIVPEGLGGDQVLPTASCSTCRDSTSRFEYRVLRQSYGFRATRSALRIGKRRRNEKPNVAPIQVETPSGKIEQRLPLLLHPLPLVLPLLDIPSILSKRAAPVGIRVHGYHNYSAGPDPRTTLTYLGERKIYIKGRNYDHDFAKLIAKIAWCSWVSAFGAQYLVESWLPAVILGEDESAGKYIGTLDYALAGLAAPPCLHAVHLALCDHGGSRYAVARVQFFLQLTPCPTYVAVIGRLDDEIKVDASLSNWTLPKQGMIGRPLPDPVPRWIGTVVIGRREDGAGKDIHDELKSIGLVA